MKDCIENQANKLNLNKIYPYAIVGILVLALSIRLIGLNKGIWMDDQASISMFSQKNVWQTFQELRKDTHPPLYFVLLHFWAKISNSDAFLRLPSVFFSVGTVLVVMRWIKLYSDLASLLAGFSFATLPIMLRYSHEIRGYSLLVFATALTFFFASRVIKEAEKNSVYIGLAFSLIIAVSTHMIGIMLIAPIFIFLILSSRLENKKIHYIKIISIFIIVFIIFCFYYFLFLNPINAASKISWLPSISLTSLSFTANYAFGAYSTLYYPNYIDPIVTFIIITILAALVVFGKSKKALPFLVAGIIYLLQIISYSSFKAPIFWFTTVLPVLVPLVGFTALQIDAIRNKKIQRGFIGGFTILSLIFTGLWVTNEAWKPLEEFKQVTELVKSKWHPNNLVVIYPSYIQGTISRYWPNLPAPGVVSVDSWELRENLNLALNVHPKVSSISLIVRVDATVKNEVNFYNNILSSIESKTAKPLSIKIVLIIANGFKKTDIGSDTINKLLAIQASKFGHPLSYEDKGTYVSSEYKLWE
jgi:uncharacterized membrane protein